MLLDQANFHIRLKPGVDQIPEEKLERVYAQAATMLDALQNVISVTHPDLEVDWNWVMGPEEIEQDSEEIIHWDFDINESMYQECWPRKTSHNSSEDISKVNCPECLKWYRDKIKGIV